VRINRILFKLLFVALPLGASLFTWWGVGIGVCKYGVTELTVIVMAVIALLTSLPPLLWLYILRPGARLELTPWKEPRHD